MYVREIQRSLKSRFNEHWRPSPTTSEVVKHIHRTTRASVELENTEILSTESRWFERKVKEAIYIRVLNSPQQRWWKVQFASGMGQHQEESEVQTGRGGGISFPSSHTTSPTTSPR